MRRVLFRLALVGFLCRALVPSGFMPAPLADGGPIRLCHGGPAGALLALLEPRGSDEARFDVSALHDAASHEHHAAADVASDEHLARHAAASGDHHAVHEGWDRCPVGSAFAFALVASDPPPVQPAAPGPLPVDEPAALVPRVLGGGYLARAPPLV